MRRCISGCPLVRPPHKPTRTTLEASGYTVYTAPTPPFFSEIGLRNSRAPSDILSFPCSLIAPISGVGSPIHALPSRRSWRWNRTGGSCTICGSLVCLSFLSGGGALNSSIRFFRYRHHTIEEQETLGTRLFGSRTISRQASYVFRSWFTEIWT